MTSGDTSLSRPCPRCGYDLGSPPVPAAGSCTCPECGATSTWEQLARFARRADCAWFVVIGVSCALAIILWSVAGGIIGNEGRASLRATHGQDTARVIQLSAVFGAPSLWMITTIVVAMVGARALRRAGRRGQAIALRLLASAVAILGGLTWMGYLLFAWGMSGIPPP